MITDSPHIVIIFLRLSLQCVLSQMKCRQLLIQSHHSIPSIWPFTTSNVITAIKISIQIAPYKNPIQIHPHKSLNTNHSHTKIPYNNSTHSILSQIVLSTYSSSRLPTKHTYYCMDLPDKHTFLRMTRFSQ